MVGMAFFAAGTGGEPAGPELFSDGGHVEHAAGQVGTLLDDGAPGRPDGGGLACVREHPAEGVHVRPVEIFV